MSFQIVLMVAVLLAISKDLLLKGIKIPCASLSHKTVLQKDLEGMPCSSIIDYQLVNSQLLNMLKNKQLLNLTFTGWYKAQGEGDNYFNLLTIADNFEFNNAKQQYINISYKSVNNIYTVTQKNIDDPNQDIMVTIDSDNFIFNWCFLTASLTIYQQSQLIFVNFQCNPGQQYNYFDSNVIRFLPFNESIHISYGQLVPGCGFSYNLAIIEDYAISDISNIDVDVYQLMMEVPKILMFYSMNSTGQRYMLFDESSNANHYSQNYLSSEPSFDVTESGFLFFARQYIQLPVVQQEHPTELGVSMWFKTNVVQKFILFQQISLKNENQFLLIKAWYVMQNILRISYYVNQAPGDTYVSNPFIISTWHQIFLSCVYLFEFDSSQCFFSSNGQLPEQQIINSKIIKENVFQYILGHKDNNNTDYFIVKDVLITDGAQFNTMDSNDLSANCASNCDLYLTNGKCLLCSQNSYLSFNGTCITDNECVTRDLTFRKCLDQNFTCFDELKLPPACNQCKEKYVLIDGQCQRCNKRCKTCDATLQCTECDDTTIGNAPLCSCRNSYHDDFNLGKCFSKPELANQLLHAVYLPLVQTSFNDQLCNQNISWQVRNSAITYQEIIRDKYADTQFKGDLGFSLWFKSSIQPNDQNKYHLLYWMYLNDVGNRQTLASLVIKNVATRPYMLISYDYDVGALQLDNAPIKSSQWQWIIFSLSTKDQQLAVATYLSYNKLWYFKSDFIQGSDSWIMQPSMRLYIGIATSQVSDNDCLFIGQVKDLFSYYINLQQYGLANLKDKLLHKLPDMPLLSFVVTPQNVNFQQFKSSAIFDYGKMMLGANEMSESDFDPKPNIYMGFQFRKSNFATLTSWHHSDFVVKYWWLKESADQSVIVYQRLKVNDAGLFSTSILSIKHLLLIGEESYKLQACVDYICLTGDPVTQAMPISVWSFVAVCFASLSSDSELMIDLYVNYIGKSKLFFSQNNARFQYFNDTQNEYVNVLGAISNTHNDIFNIKNFSVDVGGSIRYGDTYKQYIIQYLPNCLQETYRSALQGIQSYCILCENGYQLKNGTCVVGFHNCDLQWKQCAPRCLHDNKMEEDCLNCPTGQGFYANKTTRECLPCTQNCKQCLGPRESDCLQCDETKSYQDLINRTCIQCGERQYGDNSQQSCFNCSESCQTCYGFAEFMCTSCDMKVAYLEKTTGRCVFYQIYNYSYTDDPFVIYIQNKDLFQIRDYSFSFWMKFTYLEPMIYLNKYSPEKFMLAFIIENWDAPICDDPLSRYLSLSFQGFDQSQTISTLQYRTFNWTNSDDVNDIQDVPIEDEEQWIWVYYGYSQAYHQTFSFTYLSGLSKKVTYLRQNIYHRDSETQYLQFQMGCISEFFNTFNGYYYNINFRYDAQAYINSILDQFFLANARPSSIPLSVQPPLTIPVNNCSALNNNSDIWQLRFNSDFVETEEYSIHGWVKRANSQNQTEQFILFQVYQNASGDAQSVASQENYGDNALTVMLISSNQTNQVYFQTYTRNFQNNNFQYICSQFDLFFNSWFFIYFGYSHFRKSVSTYVFSSLDYLEQQKECNYIYHLSSSFKGVFLYNHTRKVHGFRFQVGKGAYRLSDFDQLYTVVNPSSILQAVYFVESKQLCEVAPQGQLANISSGELVLCTDENCLICDLPFLNICLKCNNSRSFLNQTDGQCVNCPEFYFGSDYEQACRECDPTCKTCFGPDSNNCLSCPINGFKFWDNTTFSCVETCPPGSFSYEKHNVCLTRCPSGLYANSLLRSCVQYCNTQLQIPYADPSTSSCVSTCPPNYHLGVSYRSYTCIPFCNILAKVLFDEMYCLDQCPSGFYLNNQKRKCTETCPYQLLANNNSCQSNCSSGLFTNYATRQCVSQCNEIGLASDYSNMLCVEVCPPGLYLNNLIDLNCTEKCPQGFYADDYSQKCVKKCTYFNFSDPLSQQCVNECPFGLFGDQVQKECVTHCPSETLPDDNTRLCIPSCPQGLLYFYSGNTSNCLTQCPQGTFANEEASQCLLSCPSQLFKDVINRRCVRSCSNDTITDRYNQQCAQECHQGRFKNSLSNTCEDSCPLGYYEEVNVCVLACSKGLVANLNTMKCVSTCPNGYFIDYQIGQCTKKCSANQYTVISNQQCATQCPPDFIADQLLRQCLFNCPAHLQYFYNDVQNGSQYCVSQCPGLNLLKDELYKKCVTECQEGFYADQKARACVYVCPQGFFAQVSPTRECVQECMDPNRPYANSLTRMCEDRCSEHLLADPASKTCVENCPTSTYADPSTGLCSLNCSRQFKLDSINRRCSCACPEGFFAFADSQQCVETCPSDYFVSINEGLCVKNCPIGTFGDPSAINKSCVENCPEGYLADIVQQMCTLSCSEGLFSLASSRKCFRICPDGYYSDPIYRNCTTQCPSLLLADNTTMQCISTCIKGYFADRGSGQCVTQCTSPLDFHDRLTWECTQLCSHGQYGEPQSHECVLSCPSDHFADISNKICVSSCGTQMYTDLQNRACRASCLPSQATDSIQRLCLLLCQINTYFNPLSQFCSMQCPPEYYVDKVNRLCILGDKVCQKGYCINTTSHYCQKMGEFNNSGSNSSLMARTTSTHHCAGLYEPVGVDDCAPGPYCIQQEDLPNNTACIHLPNRLNSQDFCTCQQYQCITRLENGSYSCQNYEVGLLWVGYEQISLACLKEGEPGKKFGAGKCRAHYCIERVANQTSCVLIGSNSGSSNLRLVREEETHLCINLYEAVGVDECAAGSYCIDNSKPRSQCIQLINRIMLLPPSNQVCDCPASQCIEQQADKIYSCESLSAAENRIGKSKRTKHCLTATTHSFTENGNLIAESCASGYCIDPVSKFCVKMDKDNYQARSAQDQTCVRINQQIGVDSCATGWSFCIDTSHPLSQCVDLNSSQTCFVGIEAETQLCIGASTLGPSNLGAVFCKKQYCLSKSKFFNTLDTKITVRLQCEVLSGREKLYIGKRASNLHCETADTPGMVECSPGYCLTLLNRKCIALVSNEALGRGRSSGQCLDSNTGAESISECAANYCIIMKEDRLYYCVPISDAFPEQIGKERLTHYCLKEQQGTILGISICASSYCLVEKPVGYFMCIRSVQLKQQLLQDLSLQGKDAFYLNISSCNSFVLSDLTCRNITLADGAALFYIQDCPIITIVNVDCVNVSLTNGSAFFRILRAGSIDMSPITMKDVRANHQSVLIYLDAVQTAINMPSALEISGSHFIDGSTLFSSSSSSSIVVNIAKIKVQRSQFFQKSMGFLILSNGNQSISINEMDYADLLFQNDSMAFSYQSGGSLELGVVSLANMTLNSHCILFDIKKTQRIRWTSLSSVYLNYSVCSGAQLLKAREISEFTFSFIQINFTQLFNDSSPCEDQVQYGLLEFVAIKLANITNLIASSFNQTLAQYVSFQPLLLYSSDSEQIECGLIFICNSVFSSTLFFNQLKKLTINKLIIIDYHSLLNVNSSLLTIQGVKSFAIDKVQVQDLKLENSQQLMQFVSIENCLLARIKQTEDTLINQIFINQSNSFNGFLTTLIDAIDISTFQLNELNYESNFSDIFFSLIKAKQVLKSIKISNINLSNHQQRTIFNNPQPVMSSLTAVLFSFTNVSQDISIVNTSIIGFNFSHKQYIIDLQAVNQTSISNMNLIDLTLAGCIRGLIALKDIQSFKLTNITVLNTQQSLNSDCNSILLLSNATKNFEISFVQYINNKNLAFLAFDSVIENYYNINSDLFQEIQVQSRQILNDSVNLNDITIVDTVLRESSAIYIHANLLSVERVNFTSNICTHCSGSALSLKSTSFNIIDSHFINNSASLNGGAIYSTQNSSQPLIGQVSNTSFQLNRARLSGGAIYFDGVLFSITNCSISFNTALIGGGIRYTGASAISPAITIMQANTSSNIRRTLYILNQFSNNKAEVFGNDFCSYLGQFVVSSIDGKLSPMNTLGNTIYFLPNVYSGQVFKRYFTITLLDQDGKQVNLSKQSYQLLVETGEDHTITNYELELSYDKQSSIIEGQQRLTLASDYNFDLNAFTFSELSVIAKPGSQISVLISTPAQSQYILNSSSSLFYRGAFSVEIKFQLRDCKAGELYSKRNDGFATCFECPLGFFLLTKPDFNAEYQVCKKCPFQVGAKSCQGSNILLEGGFWRESEQTDEILHCINNPSSCLSGSGKQLALGMHCAQGYYGPLCESCDLYGKTWVESDGDNVVTNEKRDSYANSQKFVCENCSSLYIIQIVNIVIKYILVSGLLIIIYLLTQQRSYTNIVNLYLKKANLARMGKTEYRGYLLAATKIFIGFYQIHSITGDLKIRFPGFIHYFLHIIGDPIEDLYYAYDCFYPSSFDESDIQAVYMRLLLSLMYPISLVVLLSLIYFAILRKQGIYPISRAQTTSDIQTLVLITYTFTAPGIINQLCNVLACRKIGQHQYILAGLQYECYTPSHQVWIVLCFLLLFANVMLIPALLIWFLIKKRGSSPLQTRYRSIKAFSYLYLDYTPLFFYWDFIYYGQKILLIFAMTFLYSLYVIRLTLVLLILIVYNLLSLTYAPYSNKTNQLDRLTSCILITSFLFIQICLEGASGFQTLVCQESMNMVIQFINCGFIISFWAFLLLTAITETFPKQVNTFKVLLIARFNRPCFTQKVLLSLLSLINSKSMKPLLNWKKMKNGYKKLVQQKEVSQLQKRIFNLSDEPQNSQQQIEIELPPLDDQHLNLNLSKQERTSELQESKRQLRDSEIQLNLQQINTFILENIFFNHRQSLTKKQFMEEHKSLDRFLRQFCKYNKINYNLILEHYYSQTQEQPHVEIDQQQQQ